MYDEFARPICMDPCSVARDKDFAQNVQQRCDVMYTILLNNFLTAIKEGNPKAWKQIFMLVKTSRKCRNSVFRLLKY